MTVLACSMPFEAVGLKFQRMCKLQEVSASARTDVRMVIDEGETVGEIVSHIFTCYAQALDAVPLKMYDPARFVLKITGFRDYLRDVSEIIGNYQHVHHCLEGRKTLRLSLVHTDDLEFRTKRTFSLHQGARFTTANTTIPNKKKCLAPPLMHHRRTMILHRVTAMHPLTSFDSR